MKAAAKLETVLEFLNAGLINKDTAREMLGFNVPEPKFKIGQTIYHIHGYKGIIDDIGRDDDFNPTYHLKDQDNILWWIESSIISEYTHDFERLINDQK